MLTYKYCKVRTNLQRMPPKTQAAQTRKAQACQKDVADIQHLQPCS